MSAARHVVGSDEKNKRRSQFHYCKAPGLKVSFFLPSEP